jgi:hypothetical protein
MRPKLSPNEKRTRAIAALALPGALALLWFARPDAPPGWFPFALSCGAASGLPCIFCGTTRAVHFLLHGEFGRALYFNWLAFPLVAGALALEITLLAELLAGRNFLARLPRVRMTRRSLGVGATAFVLLWVLQVYLAVSQHKTELLNPHGPLYSLVVH